MKKLMMALMVTALCVIPVSMVHADDKSTAEEYLGQLYDKIPEAEYVITLWLPDGNLAYRKCNSCEEARLRGYQALYYDLAKQIKITSTYPTAQTRCWFFGKIFTRENMNELF